MRPIKSILFISLLLTLIPTLESCRPDDPVPPTPSPLALVPEVIKDMFYFKPGSFWIYEDSASGILDTITVTEFSVDTATAVDARYEVFTLSTYSSFYEYFYIYQENGSGNYEYYTPIVNIHKSRSGHYEGESIVLFHPFTIGSKRYPGTPGTFVQIIGQMDSVVVFNNTYKGCILTHDDYCQSEPDYPKVYYTLAQDVGIVIKRIENTFSPSYNKTWKLKSSLLIK